MSAHVIVDSGEVRLVLPSDRHVWAGDLIGVPEAHSIPLRPETKAHESELRELVDEAVAALGVSDGPLYFQVILTRSGPRIVEIASRLDGCHLWRLVKLATGYDLLNDVLGRLTGEDWRAPEDPRIEPSTLRFFLDSPDTLVSDAYRSSTQSPDPEYVEWQLEPDGSPRRTNDVVARLGYEITRGIPQ